MGSRTTLEIRAGLGLYLERGRRGTLFGWPVFFHSFLCQLLGYLG